MKYTIFFMAILMAGCAQISSDDDDLDTRPVTNNVFRKRPAGGPGVAL